jgi:hypothetical protein
MVVLREPGEVFVLRHTLGRRPLCDATVAWVEQIDARTLEPRRRSPDLAAGPFWPGGLAAHANGSLHVVYGRYCHRSRLSSSCWGPASSHSLAPTTRSWCSATARWR